MDRASALGIISSVITVVQLTGQCLKLSSKYIGPSQHSSEELRSMQVTLYSFNASIKNLQTHLEICEEDQARLRALEYLGGSLNDCKNVLKVLEDHLRRTKSLGDYIVGARFDSKLKRCFAALNHSKTLFMEAVHADQQTIISAVEQYVRIAGADIRDIKESVDSGNNAVLELSERSKRNHGELRALYSSIASDIHRAEKSVLDHEEQWRIQDWQRQQRDKDRTIVEWLSSHNTEAKQSDVLNRRYPGTGTWLIDHSLFQDWAAGPTKSLWCRGIPGAGKTILAAVAVDHLKTSFDMSESAVACVYCSYEERNTQSTLSIFESILKQVALARPTISDELSDLYYNHQMKRTRPALDDIMSLLLSEVKALKRVFIVIDALDELSTQMRNSLLRKLSILKPYLHLMVTSRPSIGTLKAFEDTAEMEIRASELDISVFTAARLQEDDRLAGWTRNDDPLTREILETIVRNAQGMFLLAELHLNALAEAHNKKQLRTNILDLPSELDQTYENALRRIRKQDITSVHLSHRILSWLSYAHRSLTVTTLQHALAIEPGEKTFDEEAITDEQILVSVCAGLVTVDEESQVIRLVHYTTQEYFERVRHEQFPNAQIEITQTCLTYLLLDEFVEPYKSDEDRITERDRYSFFEYAAQNWGHHVCGPGETILETVILDFLAQETKLRNSLKFMGLSFSKIHGYKKMITISDMCIAAFFGLKHILNVQMRQQVATRMLTPFSPLYYAIIKGHEEVVTFLLEHGAELSGKAFSWRDTAISLALNDCEDIPMTTLLLRNGADINAVDARGYSPLQIACDTGDERALHSLLELGADVDYVGFAHTNTADSQGPETIAEFRDARGKYVDATCASGETALQIAVKNGYLNLTRMLLEKGAKVNLVDNRGDAALLKAAKYGSKKMVQMLLRHGAEVNASNLEGETALGSAALLGHISCVDILLGNPNISFTNG